MGSDVGKSLKNFSMNLEESLFQHQFSKGKESKFEDIGFENMSIEEISDLKSFKSMENSITQSARYSQSFVNVQFDKNGQIACLDGLENFASDTTSNRHHFDIFLKEKILSELVRFGCIFSEKLKASVEELKKLNKKSHTTPGTTDGLNIADDDEDFLEFTNLTEKNRKLIKILLYQLLEWKFVDLVWLLINRYGFEDMLKSLIMESAERYSYLIKLRNFNVTSSDLYHKMETEIKTYSNLSAIGFTSILQKVDPVYLKKFNLIGMKECQILIRLGYVK
jgi:hypothetical protein